jgi:hypothetical protein
MSSAESFKSMYKEFINQIIKEFPDNDKAKDEKLAIYKYTGDHMKKFIKRLHTPIDYSAMINEKNELLFSSDCKLIKDIGLCDVWPSANDEAKNVIWQYLGSMNMMASALSNIPAPMLKSIEALAEQLASQMEGMDMSSFNLGNLPKMDLSKMDLSKMDLGSLMRGMNAAPSTPVKTKKISKRKK